MYKKAKTKRSFKEFSKDLREGKLAQVILMYGIEQYLVRWAAETIVKKFVNPASMSMDYMVFDDELTEPGKIIEACNTFSMFSDKKVIWVRNHKLLNSDTMKGATADEIKALVEYVENSNEGTILIFSAEEVKDKCVLTKAIKSKGAYYEFETLERGELTSFASKRFKSSGIEVAPAAMRRLIEETGYFNKDSDYTLFNFENDILKIIAHSNGMNVTEGDINEVVCGDMETFVFDLLDGITSNQKDKALKILHNRIHEGEAVQPLIATIISQFEMLLSIKQMREDGLDLRAMQKIIGGSEYRIKKLIPYSNKYSLEKLKEILSNAYEISWNIFSGLLEEQLAMEMFIAKI